MKTIRFFTVACILCLSFGLTAQDHEALVKEFQEIRSHFLDQTKLSYTIKYLLFDELDAFAPTEELIMDFRVKNKSMYCQYENYELLKKGTEAVVVDHLTRRVSLAPAGLAEANEGNELIQQFESWIKFLDLTGTRYQTENGHVGIRFSSVNGTQSKIELEYDQQNKMISRCFFAMDLSNYSEEEREELDIDFDQKKIEVRYYDFEKEQINFPSALTEILLSKGHSLKGKYAGYEVNKL